MSQTDILYKQKKEALMQKITKRKYEEVNFTLEDEEANEVFRKLIIKEKDGYPEEFYQTYTLRDKEKMEKSNLWKYFYKMPKGSILHLHFDTCNDIDWFFDTLAFIDTTFFNPETNTFKYFKNKEVAE